MIIKIAAAASAAAALLGAAGWGLMFDSGSAEANQTGGEARYEASHGELKAGHEGKDGCPLDGGGL